MKVVIARVWNLETAIVPMVIGALGSFPKNHQNVADEDLNNPSGRKAQRHCRDRVVTRCVGSGIRSPKLGIKDMGSCRDQRQNLRINTSLDLSKEDLKF